MFLATGKYSVLRGSVTDQYGDEVDANTIVHDSVLGSVLESARTAYNPANSRVSTVRELVGRFKSGMDIRDGDRIRDEKTGQIFVVSAVRQTANVAVAADVVVELSTTSTGG